MRTMKGERQMITCRLNGKEYHIDFISGRALREIGPADEMYRRVMAATNAAVNGGEYPKDAPTIREAMDEMVKWFCLVFGNQFTPDEVYDYYPVDRVMRDMALTLIAVQSQMTQVLSEFPTKPKATGEEKA